MSRPLPPGTVFPQTVPDMSPSTLRREIGRLKKTLGRALNHIPNEHECYEVVADLIRRAHEQSIDLHERIQS